jgi:hypothetical protein
MPARDAGVLDLRMPIPTIAFLDGAEYPHGHPSSIPFFQRFPIEPIHPAPQTLEIVAVHQLDHMNWFSLVRAILARVAPGGSVLVVTHGAAGGVAIPMLPGTMRVGAEAMAEATVLSRIWNDGSHLSEFFRASERTAARLHVDAHDARLFSDLIRDVQQLRLRRVEFRACNLGRHRSTMEHVRRLFGSVSLGAPVIRDTYFSPSLYEVQPPNTWTAWEAYTRHNRFDFYEGYGRVSLLYREDQHSHLEVKIAAERLPAILHWVETRFGPPRRPTGNQIPMHAFYGRPPLFPREDAYRTHLRSVP